jgi:putative regulator of septum formation
MRPSRRPASRRACAARSLCVLTAALVLTSGCSSSDEPPVKVGLGPGLPKVGACRVLRLGDVAPASNDTPPVPCSRPHTSVTIAVGSFTPAQVTNQRLADGTLGNLALQRCTEEWKQAVGGDVSAQHLSLLGLAYYLPNQSQLSRGARWYRCDVILGGEDGLGLQPLPPDIDGILDGTPPESVQACRTTPDFTSGHAVPCSQPHVLRAIGTTTLPDEARFPGNAALRTASAKGCSRVIARWLKGRVDGGDAYQWPDRTGWNVLGDHTATCWTVSS